MSMNDSKILSILRGYEHWTTEQPWKDIADRFEMLIEKEKLSDDTRKDI
jgi:hypothetical protein